MGLNSWNFTGNLGKDCETKYTPSGDAVVSFSVGVQSGYGDKAVTTWARCQMWGKRGEAVAPFLLKSQLVGVTGEVTNREYTDKDGNKRTSLDVRVNDLALLGKKDGAQQERSQPAPQRQQPAPAKAATEGGSGFADFDDDFPPF
jgi:single-strand DNA-binding protein